MNGFEQSVSDVELDRLVDGELSTSEQRALLQRVQRDADGWRKLALAFLEAQALRQVCPGLLTDGPYPAPEAEGLQPLGFPHGTKTVAERSWRQPSIAAAAVACAFLLGQWSHTPNKTLDKLAPVAMPEPSQSAASTPPIERLSVVFPDGEGEWSQPVVLPVVDRTDERLQAWLGEQPVWPAAVYEALRESGRQVSEERRWMEVDLADGRRGYVPVSELVVSAEPAMEYP
jgi:hypothetical protein